MSLANEPDFKRTLRRAARLGLLTGKVSGEQWIEIQGILNNPVRKNEAGQDVDLLAEVAQESVSCMQEQQLIGAEETVQTINWTGILAFLQQVMPMILQFIQALLVIFPK